MPFSSLWTFSGTFSILQSDWPSSIMPWYHLLTGKWWCTVALAVVDDKCYIFCQWKDSQWESHLCSTNVFFVPSRKSVPLLPRLLVIWSNILGNDEQIEEAQKMVRSVLDLPLEHSLLPFRGKWLWIGKALTYFKFAANKTHRTCMLCVSKWKRCLSFC